MLRACWNRTSYFFLKYPEVSVIILTLLSFLSIPTCLYFFPIRLHITVDPFSSNPTSVFLSPPASFPCHFSQPFPPSTLHKPPACPLPSFPPSTSSDIVITVLSEVEDPISYCYNLVQSYSKLSQKHKDFFQLYFILDSVFSDPVYSNFLLFFKK
ncbi:hypothetical protein GEMRC1_008619 [Eukaryota sp. GEM-RC1]